MEMINVLKRLAELDAMNPNIQTEGSKHASRPGTEKRPGSADQAQKTLDRKKEVKAAAEKRRSEKGVEEGFDVKDSSGKVVHTAFSQGEAKKKAEELSKSGNKHSVSYNRTSHPKEDVEEGLGYRGVGGARRYDDDEGWGSGWKKPTPKEAYAVHINGKKWKTFSDKAEADRVASAVGKKYPDKRVLVMPHTVRESSSDIRENTQVDECGMGVMGAAPASNTPASLNITAGSGDELSGILKDIAQLAGIGNAAAEPAQAVLSPTPTIGISTTDGEDMRSVIDRMNAVDDEGDEEYGDEEETDEDYDNSPANPNDYDEYNSNELAYHPNPPGAADGRAFANNPRAVPEDIEARLFADYQSFINEGSKPDFLDADGDGDKKEPMKQAFKQRKMKK